MKKEAQYRVNLPPGKSISQIRAWCKKNLNGGFKVTYHRIYDAHKKKWVRNYVKPVMIRFREEGDALAFKLIWSKNDAE